MLHIAVAVLIGGAFQDPPPPPPPRPPMPAPRDLPPDPRGTAVIKGHVVTADGRPLRRVQVRVSGGPLREGATATTGLEGEYEIPELPAGRYTIQATRSGYLPTSFGQRAYGEASTPVEIANGAT